jgi:hypothetical protein
MPPVLIRRMVVLVFSGARGERRETAGLALPGRAVRSPEPEGGAAGRRDRPRRSGRSFHPRFGRRVYREGMIGVDRDGLPDQPLDVAE